MEPILDARLQALVGGIAADINAIIAKLNQEDAAAQTSANTAIQSIDAAIASLINDAVVAKGTTWSSTQIEAYVVAQISAAVANVSPGLLTAINTVSAGLTADQSAVATILSTLAAAVRFDIDQSHTITDAQKAQACLNIGAVSEANLTGLIDAEIAAQITTITTAVEAAIPPVFTDIDLLSAYSAARTVTLN